jgi:hypothetical protein
MNAPKAWITVAALGAAGLAGCAASDPFVGTYDYEESNTFTIETPEQAPPMSGTAKGTLTIAATSGGDYLVTIEPPPGTGGEACALTATATGMSLSFAAKQSCKVSGMGATGTATLTSGSGELADTTLTLDLAYDVSASSPQGAFTATTTDKDTATRQ